MVYALGIVVLGVIYFYVAVGMIGNTIDCWKHGRKGLGWLTLGALTLFVLMTLGKI